MYHTLWLPWALESSRGHLDRLLLDQLSRIVARASGPGPIWVESRQHCNEARLRESASNNPDAIFDEFAAHEKTLNSRIATLEQELDDVREQHNNAQDIMERLQATIRIISIPSDQTDDAEVITAISSVESAVILAQQRLSGLYFLPSAIESARETPYEHHDRVFFALTTLNRLAGALSLDGGNLGMRREDWFRDQIGTGGITYSPNLGSDAINRYGDEYRFEYKGESLLMQEHVSLGDSFNPRHCLRIYAHWDSDDQRYVIGHLGVHLTNSHSQ